MPSSRPKPVSTLVGLTVLAAALLACNLGGNTATPPLSTSTVFPTLSPPPGPTATTPATLTPSAVPAPTDTPPAPSPTPPPGQEVILLLEPGPVGRVPAQVDVLGRPVGVLPVQVELLRILEGDPGRRAHAGILARMIAEAA